MKLNAFQKKAAAFLLLVSCMNYFFGCQRFYRPVILNTPSLENKQTTLKKLSEENRYFIMRKDSTGYNLTNIILDPDKMTLTATIKPLPLEHQVYLNVTKPNKYNYSKRKKQDVVLTEVHIYTAGTPAVNFDSTYVIALSDIEKIEMIEYDKRRTTNSYVWGTIGVVLGAAIVISIIALITYEPPPPPPTQISSCPYISIYDGKRYLLKGEIYSAAIYPSLQREDFLPLDFKPENNIYQVKISNELKEIQYTDFTALLMVDHDKNIEVGIDPGGNPFSISNLVSPASAKLNNNTDVSQQIASIDKNSCFFNGINHNGDSEDLYLSFKKDVSSTRGKLLVNAKTSSWVNYLYDEFSKGFGSYYNKWVAQQEKKPAAELLKWSEDQHIPLSISAKTNTGWKEIKKIQPVGPILNREMIVSFDLPEGDLVELKLSTGYMFWELDYAAMDFSDDVPMIAKQLLPVEAINEKGNNVLPELSKIDNRFLLQPAIGDYTVIKFRCPEIPEGLVRTVFFHSSGYYKTLREYKGMPDTDFLKGFERKGAFTSFSKQTFYNLLEKFEPIKYQADEN